MTEENEKLKETIPEVKEESLPPDCHCEPVHISRFLEEEPSEAGLLRKGRAAEGAGFPDAKTSFQGTLDQVGTNTANIDTLYGYFVGSAHFQNLQIDGVFMFGGKYIGTTQKTVDGRTLYYLEWRDP